MCEADFVIESRDTGEVSLVSVRGSLTANHSRALAVALKPILNNDSIKRVEIDCKAVDRIDRVGMCLLQVFLLQARGQNKKALLVKQSLVMRACRFLFN